MSDVKLKYLIMDSSVPPQYKSTFLARLAYEERRASIIDSACAAVALPKPTCTWAKMTATIAPAYSTTDIPNITLALLQKLAEKCLLLEPEGEPVPDDISIFKRW